MATDQHAEAPGHRVLTAIPGPVLLTGSMLTLQLSAALAVGLFAHVGAPGAALLRQGLAAAILWALVRPRLRGRAAAEVRLVLVLGVVLGLMNLAFYEAITRLPLGVVVTIEFLGPLAVALLGSRTRVDAALALVAAGGVALIATDASGGGAGADLAGIGFAALAAVCWGTYIVVVAAAGARLPGVDGLVLASPIGAALLLVPGVAAGGTALLEPHVLALGAAVAVLSSVLSVSFEMEALRRIPRHLFGLIMSAEPAIGAAAGAIVLGQRLSIRELTAMALITLAVVGATRRRARAAPPPVAP